MFPVWDYDPTGRILGDDQIGETVIDLEDRWFSPEFQRMRQKVAEDGVTALMPIELRQLYDSTGKLRIPQARPAWMVFVVHRYRHVVYMIRMTDSGLIITDLINDSRALFYSPSNPLKSCPSYICILASSSRVFLCCFMNNL